MEQLVWSSNKCEIFKPLTLLPTIIMICLGYAIEPVKQQKPQNEKRKR